MRGYCFNLGIAILCLASVARGQNASRDEGTRLQLRTLDSVPQPELLPHGKPTTGLSLPQLEEMALMANPSLGRAASLVAAARGNWVQVGLPPNPSVGYEGQQLGSGGQAEQHGVAFGQEFVRGGKLRLNRAVAQRELVRAEQELAAQRQRVITDVRIAFFNALLAQRQIDVTSDLVRISQQGLNATEALFRAKESSKVDVLQAQLELENAQILAENARNRHVAAWQSLCAVVGQPDLPPQPLAGDAFLAPCVYNLRATLDRLLSVSPEMSVAVAEIDRARAALERARVEPRPNVNVQGLVNWVDNGIGGKPDGAIAVTVPLPLWNKNQGGILKAEHELAAAVQARGQLELDLLNRLAPAFERYANARSQVERYRTKILPAAQESLTLTQRAHAAGEVAFLNQLTVQRTFTQANLNYLESLRTLRITEAELEGFLLSGSLQSR